MPDLPAARGIDHVNQRSDVTKDEHLAPRPRQHSVRDSGTKRNVILIYPLETWLRSGDIDGIQLAVIRHGEKHRRPNNGGLRPHGGCVGKTESPCELKIAEVAGRQSRLLACEVAVVLLVETKARDSGRHVQSR